MEGMCSWEYECECVCDPLVSKRDDMRAKSSYFRVENQYAMSKQKHQEMAI